MLCWFSYSIVFHRHTSFSVKADRTLQYCVSQAHIILIQGWCHIVMLCWFSYSIVFHRHISFSVKADGAELCCAGSGHIFSVKADRTLQYCVSQTHIILIQGWWRTVMLCWFSYSIVFHGHIFSVKADRTLQYCVSRTHIILIQGWWRTVMSCWFSYSIVFHRHKSFSFKAYGTQLCCAGSPIVLCFTDTYHSQSRLMAHSYVVLVLLQHCVSRTHIILSEGWSHPTVLCLTDTYHSHSRLMTHIYVVLVLLQYCVSQTYHSQSRLIAPYSIVFHRHISFSFKADGAQLCCAGSPIVFCVTWHTFSVKADGAHLCYIIILSVYFTVGVMS